MFRLAFLIALACVPASATLAQSYPTRPIHLVVGAPVGSGMDVAVRLLAEKMQEQLGQPLVVENRAGADGILAAQRVALAAPDGYTLLPSTTSQLSVNPALRDDLPYDPLRSFEAIGMFARVQLVLVVNASVPVNSVSELIAYARTNPGALDYGSGSSIFMFATEVLKSLTGTDMRQIPYSGVPAVVQALVAGDIDVGIVNTTPSLAHIRSGKLKALAIMGPNREPLLPDIPTIAEAGVAGYELGVWLGMFAPAGTPAPIIAQLNDAMLRSIRSSDLRQKLLASGSTPASSTARALEQTVVREIELFKRLAKHTNVAPKQ
jgi:tripartite-type tricarboxylate transporter receptor subunit TctC